jgi:hypothetical protein
MKSSTLPTFVSSDFFLNKPNKPIVILMIILFTNYYLNEWKVCPLTPTWQFVCKGTKTVGFHQHSKSFSMSGIISFLLGELYTVGGTVQISGIFCGYSFLIRK